MIDSVSDEELPVAAALRDFATLYERRDPLIRGYLRRQLGARPDLVLDLVAETFARALERREQFDLDRGPIIAWLIGIARHPLIDTARRGRVDDASRRRLGMERISFEQQELELIERDSASELERALVRLPGEQREAIEKALPRGRAL